MAVFSADTERKPMGDTEDGSSGAARRAQSDNVTNTSAHITANTVTDTDLSENQKTTARSGSFLSRVISALSPADMNVAAEAAPQTIGSKFSHGMMNLRRMRVEDVAVPKADITAVSKMITLKKLVAKFKESGLTRLPVYDGTLDTPIGFAHLKDLALTHGFNGGGGTFDLEQMLRPLLFVPPSMTIGVLLTKMQAERRHMALVIDEYGGVDGLVTIEDLIEQVVGEIEDEHDVDEDQFWSIEKTGTYLALAKTPLEDFEAEVDLSLTKHEDVDGEDIETLGGLVFMLAGRVPARGEVVIHPDGPEFEVIDADPRRIKRLRVSMPETTG
ncbi:MAG: magnesium and cobalt transporter [Ascidiaceihabitans sp.]|jgi:magnesium and cobalt transporter|tara:strand:+ start:16554 stop:17540 length:987 start_codon:yes stop_codon:yes gene_type:complete